MANKFDSTGAHVSTDDTIIYEAPTTCQAVTIIGLSAASKATGDQDVTCKLVRGADSWDLCSPLTLLPGRGTVVLVGGDQKHVMLPGDKLVGTSTVTNGYDALISVLIMS